MAVLAYLAFHAGHAHANYRHGRARGRRGINLYWSSVRGPWISSPRPVRHPDRPPPLTARPALTRSWRHPVKKILGWIALAIAVLWVIKNPAGAAADVKQFMNALSTLASAL